MQSNNIRVLALIDTYSVSGPAKGILQLARVGPSHGVTYSIGCFAYRNPQSSEFIERARAEGADLRLIQQQFRFDPRIFFRARRVVKGSSFDLIQSHGYKSHLVALYVSMLLGKPWVAVTHGWTSQSARMHLYKRIELALLTLANVAVTVSPQLHEQVSALRSAHMPTVLILNAVDPGEMRSAVGGSEFRRRFKIPLSHFVLGCFGRLSPEKGQELLIRAFSQVVATQPETVLLVVGDGPDRAKLERLVKSLGLGQQVHFAGHYAAMRDCYEAINLLVIPSLSEGLPNVALEAMSLGIPVLATEVGAIRELIDPDRTGWLVPTQDEHALTEKIGWLLTHKETLTQIGEAAKDSLFPKFSVEQRIARFREVYELALQG